MITYEQVKEAVDKVIERQGEDFVYNPGGRNICYYVPLPEMKELIANSDDHHFAKERVDELIANDPPAMQTGCVVGEALKELELLTDQIVLGGSPLSTIASFFNLPLSKDAVLYLDKIQMAQDSGESWGQARTSAQAVMEKYFERWK